MAGAPPRTACARPSPPGTWPVPGQNPAQGTPQGGGLHGSQDTLRDGRGGDRCAAAARLDARRRAGISRPELAGGGAVRGRRGRAGGGGRAVSAGGGGGAGGAGGAAPRPPPPPPPPALVEK